ncbi:MAG: hypothetical protein OMM_09812, partial [Candidatus Magnetoglobus multicellularis str. Araruama]
MTDEQGNITVSAVSVDILSEIDLKSNIADIYTRDKLYQRSEIDEKLKPMVLKSNIADIYTRDNLYTRSEIDTKLQIIDLKSNIADIYTRDNLYKRSEIDEKLKPMVLKSNIADIYTRDNLYTRSEIDTKLNTKVTISDYTPERIKSLLESNPDTHTINDSQQKAIESIPEHLKMSGGTLTGNLSMNGNNIKDLPLPTEGTDAATKNYVDSIAQGIEWQKGVIDMIDPNLHFPQRPVTGDRYIASNDGNGWQASFIYEWDGSQWIQTIPDNGIAVWVSVQNGQYVYSSSQSEWVLISGVLSHNKLNDLQGGASQEYFHLDKKTYGFIAGLDAQDLKQSASPTFSGLTIVNTDGEITFPDHKGTVIVSKDSTVNSDTILSNKARIQQLESDKLNSTEFNSEKIKDLLTQNPDTFVVTGNQIKDIDTISQKADSDDIYTKTLLYTQSEIDQSLSFKANNENVYTRGQLYLKSEIDSSLSQKLDASLYTGEKIKDKLNTLSDGKTITDKQIAAIETIPQKADIDDIYTRDQLYLKTEIDHSLNQKANTDEVYTQGQLYTKSNIDTVLSTKLDISQYSGEKIKEKLNLLSDGKTVTDEQIDAIKTIAQKAERAQVYTKDQLYVKSEVDTKLSSKLDTSQYSSEKIKEKLNALSDGKTLTDDQIVLLDSIELKANTQDVYTKTQLYTKDDIDLSLSQKADTTDVYIKSQTYAKDDIDHFLSEKANIADVYTKTQLYTKSNMDLSLSQKANIADIYTKDKIDLSLSEKANIVDVIPK